MRKLVTIRKIGGLFPIENADVIERAQIDGWNVVVKKGEFTTDDLCVYGEIDSVFPADDARFSFLEGKRLRTKKMRGVISQGIAFPVSMFGEVFFNVGDDVTELLNVKLYEPPLPKNSDIVGGFPWFIPKTDAERVQNLIEELAVHKGETAFVTEKLDGSSITIFCRQIENEQMQTGVCSRNFELRRDGESNFVSTVKRLQVMEKLQAFCETENRMLALQGELIGASVQGNKYKLPETTIRFFNVFDIANQQNVAPSEFVNIIKKLELETVPIINDEYVLHDSVETYLTEAEARSVLNPNTEREGLIYRTNDKSFMFKAISNKFLLKYE